MSIVGKARKSRNIRTILIEPFKQIKLGLYVLSITLTFVVLSAWLVWLAFSSQYEHIMGIFNVVDPNIKLKLLTNDIFYTNAIRLIVFLAIFVVVLFTVIFRTTHRIYGPIVSIDRFVKDIVRGDYSQRIIIRRNDELQDLVRNLNNMAETLEKRHGARVGDADRRSKEDRRSSSQIDAADGF